jgi:hypothetical protein
VSPPTASPAVPGPDADKHSACKPIRSVVTVRRARVGIIIVISVVTHRRTANVAPSKSHTHSDLSLRISQRQDQNSNQS